MDRFFKTRGFFYFLSKATQTFLVRMTVMECDDAEVGRTREVCDLSQSSLQWRMESHDLSECQMLALVWAGGRGRGRGHVIVCCVSQGNAGTKLSVFCLSADEERAYMCRACGPNRHDRQHRAWTCTIGSYMGRGTEGRNGKVGEMPTCMAASFRATFPFFKSFPSLLLVLHIGREISEKRRIQREGKDGGRTEREGRC